MKRILLFAIVVSVVAFMCCTPEDTADSPEEAITDAASSDEDAGASDAGATDSVESGGDVIEEESGEPDASPDSDA